MTLRHGGKHLIMKTHSFLSWRSCLAAQVVALLFCAIPANAYLTTIAYWKMGEADTNASAGASAMTAVDSIGVNSLPHTGPATYSANVAASPIPSVLSVNLTNAAYAVGALASTTNNNFGIEAWVNPGTNSAAAVILYNGSTGTSGWQFFWTPARIRIRGCSAVSLFCPRQPTRHRRTRGRMSP